MKDIWDATEDLIQEAQKMSREAERMAEDVRKAAKDLDGKGVTTYRLRAGSFGKRIALAWRVLWSGDVTIRIVQKVSVTK